MDFIKSINTAALFDLEVQMSTAVLTNGLCGQYFHCQKIGKPVGLQKTQFTFKVDHTKYKQRSSINWLFNVLMQTQGQLVFRLTHEQPHNI